MSPASVPGELMGVGTVSHERFVQVPGRRINEKQASRPDGKLAKRLEETNSRCAGHDGPGQHESAGSRVLLNHHPPLPQTCHLPAPTPLNFSFLGDANHQMPRVSVSMNSGLV